MKKIALVPAFLIFLVWFFFTFGLQFVMGTHESGIDLSEIVSKQLNYGIFLSALTCLIFAYFGKHQIRVGLSGSRKFTDKVIIIPIIFIIIAQIGAFTGGAYSNSSFVTWVLINTLFVGISEEMMFRGIFMSSFTNKFGYWPAVIWTSLIFGGIHVLNGFITGDFAMATLQAFMATCSGLLFLGIRVRTLSIITAIILHWIWDFTVFISGTVITPTEDLVSLIPSMLLVIAPVIFGIIGILSLRNKKAAEAYVASQAEG